MRLRPYQNEVIDSFFNFFASHPDVERNPVAGLPTGTGKAVIIAGFVHRVLSLWPGQRIIMATHVKELVEQNADKLRAVWPQAPLGVYSAGLGSKVAHMPVTFAGIQSAAKAPHLFGHQDVMVVDECHLVSPEDQGRYKTFLAALRQRNPYVRAVGLSATLYRLGLGMITDGGVFTDVCYDATSMSGFNRLLDDGYLSPLIPIQTETVIDVSKVKKQGGEFVNSELSAAVNREDITRAALSELVAAAADRRHWLLFAVNIEHVEAIVAMLTREFGVPAVGVHSRMGSDERDQAIADFKAGRVRALVNANILTTGFDHPELDCIGLLRPTNSPSLHVQILGRGTRPVYGWGSWDLDTVEGRHFAMAAGPKQNCLVLDFAGNTQRLGPINDPRIPRKAGDGKGEIPVKVCIECACLNHISARFCANCGAEFSFEEKLTDKASTVALIVRDEPITAWFDVARVTYEPHYKSGSPPSLKVSYYCGIRRFSEWVCLEHFGVPRVKARQWWEGRSTAPVPESVAEAHAQINTLATPRRIKVWVNKKYPEVLTHEMEPGH